LNQLINKSENKNIRIEHMDSDVMDRLEKIRFVSTQVVL